MPAYLVFRKNNVDDAIEFRGIISIGRDANSSVAIDDRSVSRNHAIIRRLGDNDYYLIDSGSLNGSYVNGKRISKPTRLNNNDQITIGPGLLIFRQNEHQQLAPSSGAAAEATTLFSPQVSIQKIAMLVADIRGFTPLTESVPVHTMSKIMSEWFHKVSLLIEASHGMLEKFIGDCVYARWDVTDDAQAVVLNALRTAVEIRRITDEFNSKYPEVAQQLRIGAAINIGNVAVGVGQSNAAVGDAVNTTFRLESASKELKCDIVVGHDAYIELPRSIWEGREHIITVKGKREPLNVCALRFENVP